MSLPEVFAEFFTVARTPKNEVVVVMHYGGTKNQSQILTPENARSLAGMLIEVANRADSRQKQWDTDGAPQDRSEVTAGWVPSGYRGPDTYDKHDERL